MQCCAHSWLKVYCEQPVKNWSTCMALFSHNNEIAVCAHTVSLYNCIVYGDPGLSIICLSVILCSCTHSNSLFCTSTSVFVKICTYHISHVHDSNQSSGENIEPDGMTGLVPVMSQMAWHLYWSCTVPISQQTLKLKCWKLLSKHNMS